MPPLAQDVEQLRQFFLRLPANEQAGAWEAMWQRRITPWDRSKPNPALPDALKEKAHILGSPLLKDAGNKKRKRALVPGCGGGYDVVLLASYGYDAVGLDTAKSAINTARALQKAEETHRADYPIRDSAIGAGRADFFEANFFEDDFLSQAGAKQFDLIYDYTFLCALPPELRPSWARRMSELLAEDGTLICLEFPLGKPLSAGGPPHGLTSDVYTELFMNPGSEISYDPDGNVVLTKHMGISTKALKKIEHWSPERSHHEGKDMASMWQHV